MRIARRLCLCALAIAVPAAAQEPGAAPAATIVGVQARGYSFESGFGLDRVYQVAVPFALLFPLGRRVTVDVGSHYVTTSSRLSGGSSTTFDGFTDTQMRASVVAGRDALVLSATVNIPSGTRPTAEQLETQGRAASNFLLFPVTSYTSGWSVTGGMAVARQFGGWTLGLASSVRWNDSYHPFSGVADTVIYDPGVEGRFRLGADRLLGASRLSLGATFSTFGQDEFSGLGPTPTRFTPGQRWIGEVGLTSPAGNGTWSVYLWDYYRRASPSLATNNGGRENLFAAVLSGRWALNPGLHFEPTAEARFWSPGQGGGVLYGIGAGLRYRVSDHFTLSPSVRGDYGRIEDKSGLTYNLVGWGSSVLFRYNF